MKTAGDHAWEVVFHPERDQILEINKLKRPVICIEKRHPHQGRCTSEGLTMPYDVPNDGVPMTMERAQLYIGSWRTELWAPSEADARRITHRQMRKRRRVTLGETR
jgi:hypothetical protein